jgi:hypothetical protein
MKLNYEQKMNLLAIEVIEIFGNNMPSQKQIDYVESFLHNHKKQLKLCHVNNQSLSRIKKQLELSFSSIIVRDCRGNV